MFVSTFPTFSLRTLPVRYGVGTSSRPTSERHGSFVRNATPAVSGRWADGAYELTADLPGIAEESVAVSVAGRTLTIDVTTDELTWNERIRLPQTLDPEQVSARYVNGRLTVTIGKTAEAAPRSIAIDTVAAASGSAQAELVAAEATETSVTE
jgi:HSP20 family molecular chaperone IbpA